MSRPALPEERGANLRLDPPTLDELRRAHDWRTEHRDRHEKGDRAFPVDVCAQCDYERPAARRGRPPDCEVREVPSRLVSLAKRHDLLPETSGARTDSMAGLPGDSEGSA